LDKEVIHRTCVFDWMLQRAPQS